MTTNWTDPRTWAIGEKVTKAILDIHIRDNENYLKERVDMVTLYPQNSIPPFSGVNAAGLQLIESSGAGTAKPVLWELLFDDTTNEARMWIFEAPGAIGASVTLKIRFHMKGANTSKKVMLNVYMACISNGDASITAKVFDSVNTSNPSVPDAANTASEVSITLSNNDGIAQGDLVCLFVERLPSDTTNDTATGDMAIDFLELSYGG